MLSSAWGPFAVRVMHEDFAIGVAVLREAMRLAAFGLALSGLDDLFVDLVWIMRRCVRMVAVRPNNPRIAAEAMGSAEPGWFAVFVPAWDEAAVIAPMLRGLVGGCAWERVRVFVGCYPNDPATIAAIASVPDPRIARVVTSRAGPTTKADCLNHLWRAALAHERAAGIRFKGIVLHDAEDVAHPLELRVFDHLLPEFALVQLPVEPLVDPASRWIAGHYLDEFAEAHAKDVCVREALGAAVPSAGVACAIARDPLERLGLPGKPFDPACFTEDYELGLRIKRGGGRGALVRVRDAQGRLVATSEHFPATLGAAVRQKSRWMLGIALDGWDRLGWEGDGADQYMLWRDRKPLFLAPLLLLAWITMLGAIVARACMAAWPALADVAPVVPVGGWLAALLTLNTALLGWRLMLRAAFTAHAHGWREGARAVPRVFAANLINMLATGRAMRRYLAIAIDRKLAVWEKTAHRIPELVS